MRGQRLAFVAAVALLVTCGAGLVAAQSGDNDNVADDDGFLGPLSILAVVLIGIAICAIMIPVCAYCAYECCIVKMQWSTYP